ncbi:MAG: hypothetical protein ACP5PT_02730, partial [Brevinematia bacterium]
EKIIIEVPQGFKEEIQGEIESIRNYIKKLTSIEFEVELKEIKLEINTEKTYKQKDKSKTKSEEAIPSIFGNVEKIDKFSEKNN